MKKTFNDNVDESLSIQEQIKSLADIFEPFQDKRLYQLAGRLIKLFGYDIAAYTFNVLKNVSNPPDNMWALAMSIAKLKYIKEIDEYNKVSIEQHKENQNIISQLEKLLLEDKISMDEFESFYTVEEAKVLLERVKSGYNTE